MTQLLICHLEFTAFYGLNLDCDEAFISMITLLRFAVFMKEHWDEVTLDDTMALAHVSQ